MNEERSFHYLARAVIRDRNEVLVAHLKGAGNTFLPGGHIEMGEGAHTALVRELNEELGLPALIRRFVGAVEHTWQDGVTRCFEINLVFEVDVPGLTAASVPDAASGAEAGLEFRWVNVADLSLHNLQPTPLVKWLQQPGDDTRAAFWGSTIDE